jgi:hypothetical protein
MDTETQGIIGLFALLFAIGIVLSIVFALARKPFERLIDRIIPGGRFSGQITRGIRISVDPVSGPSEDERISVNLGAIPEDVMGRESSDKPKLTNAERGHYLEEWTRIQLLFHETPADAVREADRLLKDLLKETGSTRVSLGKLRETEGDLGDAVEMISDVYRIAQNARSAARGIAQATQHQNPSIEDLRQAMEHYRALFDELLSKE